jgi:hypothetical protein
MAQFTGRLQGPELQPSTVLIDVADGRFRVSAGRIQIGSWPLARIHVERTSIYRFDLMIEDDKFEFYPDDPSTFSNEMGAVVDLTDTKGRFGLKERIERASNS